MYIVILGNAWSERLYLTIHQHKSNIVFIWDMLTDPKAVPHQNQSNIVFIGIC